jgi:hypothetical protein
VGSSVSLCQTIKRAIRGPLNVGDKVQLFNPGALPRSNPWYFATVAEVGVDGASARGPRKFFTTRPNGVRYYEYEEGHLWRTPPLFSWD